MRRVFRFWVGLLLGSLLVASCCANDSCDCKDSRADALYFRFRIGADSLTGLDFGRSEVDTIYLLRYPLPLTLPNSGAHDSVALLPADTTRRSNLTGTTFFLNNNGPFALATGRKVNSYEYVILVGDRKRQQFRRYIVNNISLKGKFEGDGCCTCYVNSGKSATVNSATRDSTYTLTEMPGQRPIIELTK
ncbi:hypothetical protein Q5H93_16185 [Hymenobacter sp. ASUV-10]|uniref:Lipoprotein n=1 Tax=Hymenobacter aranciens TaxID=3063996 RepID=A0ABT9BDF1_9BACT|nr:hypothetical protein [Hymenobacter sp. ASUV-10]MDO7876284.1 hypothetical protein [Hymenobacter sp. ASUV-10]